MTGKDDAAKSNNSNGWKNPKFLLTLGIIILGGACAFTVLRVTVAFDSATSEKADEILKERLDQKVDKEVFQECVKHIEENIDDIQSTQERVESKVDQLLLLRGTGGPGGPGGPGG